jgi:hypothetical protein
MRQAEPSGHALGGRRHMHCSQAQHDRQLRTCVSVHQRGRIKMASKSTLDPDNYSASSRRRRSRKGEGTGALGPSDSSDTGSDLMGLQPNSEEISLDRGSDEDLTGGHANDIDADRIIRADEAGLGGGLDQAEEARLAVQDDNRQAGPRPTTPRSNLHGSPQDQSKLSSASEENRHRHIAEAAYYRAQRRGFAPGQEQEDWIAAENDIDSENQDR